MKKLFTFLFLATTVLLSSCQSDSFLDDQTLRESPTNVVEKTTRVRLEPTSVEGAELRSTDGNAIYVDIEGQGRQVFFYIESASQTPTRIESSYNIEIFTPGSFMWLSQVYNNIESYDGGAGSGALYPSFSEANDYYSVTTQGYEAYYSKSRVEAGVWKYSIDRLSSEPTYNSVLTYMIPVRIKISHKLGGPTYRYDINMRSILSLTSTNWTFMVP